MGMRKVADRVEAVRLLGEAAGSGMARADWARKQGIDPRSLNLWRVNLERERAVRTPTGLRLVELVPGSRAPATGLRVRCGALVVELDPGFDEVALRRVLAVVVGC